ncbi:hypothetical protein ACLI4Z_01710 [Natrialbaceae archaeon A-arb3/5]
MVAVETQTERWNGITFVRGTVTNTRTTPQRVRLEPQSDGPVWPPRWDGLTSPEWTDGRWESVVEPDRTRGFGFATPADSATVSVEVTAVSRAASDESPNSNAVLAGLEPWKPSRAATPPNE